MDGKKRGIPVMINLAALASYDGVVDDPMQVLTRGTLFQKGKSQTLRYLESQEDESTGEVTEAEIELELGSGEWFSVSYDALKDAFGISKAFYNHSVRCSTVYRMDEEKLCLAMRDYPDWMQGKRELRKEIAAEIGRGTKYFMALVLFRKQWLPLLTKEAS